MLGPATSAPHFPFQGDQHSAVPASFPGHTMTLTHKTAQHTKAKRQSPEVAGLGNGQHKRSLTVRHFTPRVFNIYRPFSSKMSPATPSLTFISRTHDSFPSAQGWLGAPFKLNTPCFHYLLSKGTQIVISLHVQGHVPCHND